MFSPKKYTCYIGNAVRSEITQIGIMQNLIRFPSSIWSILRREYSIEQKSIEAHPQAQVQAQAHPQAQVQAHPQAQAQAQAHPQDASNPQDGISPGAASWMKNIHCTASILPINNLFHDRISTSKV